SLDELPQLINVVRGDMSLVGPRPALPIEVAQFDEELLARQRVRPGITGLWQVEARDSASFQAYQRLDLFYVENWSVSLDLAILIVDAERAAELKAAAADWPSWDLTPRQICDIELLMNGAFSPLSTFLGQSDYESVCSQMRLANGTIWPMPICLDLPEELAN